MNAHPITALLRELHRYRGGHIPLSNGLRRFGLGYNPDRAISKLALTDAREYFALSSVKDVSLQQFRGPQLDQTEVSGCTGFGTAQGAFVSHAAAGSPIPMPSPRIVYGIVRELELSDASQPLTDSGAMPIDLVTVMNKWGVAPIGTGCTPAMPPTPEGAYADCWTGNVNDKPSLLDLETSLQKLQVTPLLIDTTSVDFGAMIATMLENKTACGIGMFVDTNFMNYNGIKPVDNIDTNDPNGGGHWLECDYTYMLGGVQIIGGDNSWGMWGKQGSWELTLPCAQRVSDSCLAYKV